MEINTETADNKLISLQVPNTNTNSSDVAGDLHFNQVRLDDGRLVTIHRSKGRALQNAMRITQDAQERVLVLAAHAAHVDGQPFNYDDFMDLDLYYIQKITEKYNAMMGNPPSQLLPT